MNLASRAAVCLSLCCLAAIAAPVVCLLNSDGAVEDWKQSKQFTLDVAKAMPAEHYSFKATREEMSFGQQMVHIATSNVYRFHEIAGTPPPFELTPGKMPTDKEAVIRMLDQSFDYVIGILPNLTPEQLQHTWHIPDWPGRTDPSGRAMVRNMFMHVAHHRAQCEVYLRLKGIKPPVYRF